MNKIATFGEILLRISPNDNGNRINQTDLFRITVAGSEINVAVALANVGADVRSLSAIPDDIIGDKIIRKIRENGIDSDFVLRRTGSNGLFFNENGLSVRASDVIYDREHSIFSTIEFDSDYFSRALEGFKWLHVTGITPGVSRTAYNNLITAVSIANDMGLGISIDLNFRKKLWRWAIDQEIFEAYNKICSYASCIIGNESDFQEALIIEGDYTSIAEQAFRKYDKLKHIAVSNRVSLSASDNRWSGQLFRKERLSGYISKQYDLTSICDRVGTGDSFAAGIIYGLNYFDDYQKTIEFAVALSALNHTTIGDFSYFTINDVEKMISTNGSGRIHR